MRNFERGESDMRKMKRNVVNKNNKLEEKKKKDKHPRDKKQHSEEKT